MVKKFTNRKLKPTELFLSLGLVASLATACGPTEDVEVVEPEGDAIESVEEMPEMEEGGEGGEGGEG